MLVNAAYLLLTCISHLPPYVRAWHLNNGDQLKGRNWSSIVFDSTLWFPLLQQQWKSIHRNDKRMYCHRQVAFVARNDTQATMNIRQQKKRGGNKACPCTWVWHLFVMLVLHAWWSRHVHLAGALQSDSFPLVTAFSLRLPLLPACSLHLGQSEWVQLWQGWSSHVREDWSSDSCFKWKCDLVMNDWLKQRQRPC